jgi:hypothetical protein
MRVNSPCRTLVGAVEYAGLNKGTCVVRGNEMNLFDKICCVPAVILGILLLLLGIPGLFTGCRANFSLPPILGIIPALVGWGIIRAVWLAWKKSAMRPPPIPFGECDHVQSVEGPTGRGPA